MDREKVIKGLEICTTDIPMSNEVHKSDLCKECPYYDAKYSYCWNQTVMMRDVLALLKEQDYRTWIIDMFHKYNRDDLIALMVQKGEESILAGLLKEQEAHELTKTEWEQWKKGKNREPICMIWYGDTTPIWVLKPENVSEPLYLMGKIKLFNKKPRKEQVKWNE